MYLLIGVISSKLLFYFNHLDIRQTETAESHHRETAFFFFFFGVAVGGKKEGRWLPSS